MKKFIFFSILTFGFFTISFSQEYVWTDISANVPGNPSLSDVFFVSDNEGWVTSSSQAEIYHTTNGGETFEVQTTLYSCNAIHMLNENEGYAGGASGFVYRTTDGGENWNFHGTTVSNLVDISFPPLGDTGYCCGINGNIWSIDSDGVTKMTSGVPDHLYSISFPINSEEGWVCGGSIIRHYINETWTAADQDYSSGGYNAIYMVDSHNGWVVGDGGIIAHTVDGKNWFEQTNPNPNQNTLLDLFFLDENNGWAIGSGGTIVHTNNGGANWNVVAAGLSSNALTGVHFTSTTNGYVVGDGKTLLKYTEVSGVVDEVENIKFEIFPNPAVSVFILQLPPKAFGVSRQSAIVELFDLNGRKLLSKNMPKGNENMEIDVSYLESGMYLCRISTDKKSMTKKLIIE